MEKKEREKEVIQIVTMIKDNLFRNWKADVSPLLDFIDQELSKARLEELRLIKRLYLKDKSKIKYVLNQRIKELSKLKDNK